MKIQKEDMELLTSFIRRESLDFSRLKDDDKIRKEWIKDNIELIQKRIKNLTNTNHLIINSYGNIGGLIRSLTLDIFSEEGRHNVEITLCTCGKLDHTCRMNIIDIHSTIRMRGDYEE